MSSQQRDRKPKRSNVPGQVALALGLIATGVPTSAQQSALAPASSQAGGIELLWWFMFWGAVLIFVAVMVLLALGIWRARTASDTRALSARASRNLVLTAGVAIPLVVLLALVGGSLMLGRSIASQPPDDALVIRVTGWMWWWEIEYLDEHGKVSATTANELHVPVGRPVKFLLTSNDVIHSFWVPQLHGKTDLVPGVENTSWFTADESGIFRGQCAEFCGTQHALMAFLVVAEPAEDFQQWLANQARPARTPSNAKQERGKEVFMGSSCADCHTVRGTAAQGQQGPDLTHFGSRRTLAAATRPNNRGHLAGWITDPQTTKPGAFMPRSLFNPEDLEALLAYLESLE